MDTESEIKAQIAIIPESKCELCEEGEIQWKCFTCEEYMCHQCKKAHLKSKVSRSHKVTSTSGSDQQQQKHGRQEVDDTKCSTHPSEDIQMYCKHCDLPVCHDCLDSETHQYHKLTKIEKIIESKQEELSKIIFEADQKLSQYKSSMKFVKDMKENYCKDNATCTQNVKSRNTKLKEILDKITADALARIQEKEKLFLEKSEDTENKIQANITNMEELITHCRENETQPSLKLVSLVRDVKQQIDKFKSNDHPTKPTTPVLVSQDTDVKKLQTVFGLLNIDMQEKPNNQLDLDTELKFDPQVVSTFITEYQDLVVTVGNELAWLVSAESEDNENTATLVTDEGYMVQKIMINFNAYDIALTKSGELLLTVNDGNIVKKLQSDSTIVDLYQDECGFTTRGITVSDENEIIVSLYNNQTEEGKLVKMSSYGKLIPMSADVTDSVTPHLLIDPQAISTNRNGDIIVVEGSSKSVVVLNKTRSWRFTYAGQEKGLGEENFCPWYTVTDQLGQIVISNLESPNIHFLSKNGDFLGKLFIGETAGMSLDTSNRLWVCLPKDQKVTVLKLVSNKHTKV